MDHYALLHPQGEFGANFDKLGHSNELLQALERKSKIQTKPMYLSDKKQIYTFVE